MRIYANRSLASFLVMVTVASSFMELASAHSATRELRSYSNRGDRARVREARLAREEQLARDARLAERLQRGSRPMSEAALSGEERPRRRRRDKFSLNKLVIDGGHGTWPARACLSDPTSYTIHGSRIAAQCCVPPSRNRPEQCRRYVPRYGCVSGADPNLPPPSYPPSPPSLYHPPSSRPRHGPPGSVHVFRGAGALPRPELGAVHSELQRYGMPV